MVKLQDVPIGVTNEQEVEVCIQEEELVSDMTLPEVYRVDTEIHTDVQLETPMIKSEEKCVTQNEPKFVQDMALLHDTTTPSQTNAQSMTEQNGRKEIPTYTYTDSIYNPLLSYKISNTLKRGSSVRKHCLT